MAFSDKDSPAAELLRPLFRRKWLALGIAVLCSLVTVATVLNLKSIYTSSALILLPTEQSSEIALSSGRPNVGPTDPYVIRNEVEILSSDEIARAVIEQLDLAHNDTFLRAGVLGRLLRALHSALGWMKPAPTGDLRNPPPWTEDDLKTEAALNLYQRRLSVFNDGRSAVVRIAFSSEDPAQASRIVNAHAQAYLKAEVQRRNSSQEASIRWLNAELEARAAEVRQAEMAVQGYRADKRLYSTRQQDGTEANTVDQELSQLNQRLVSARGDISQYTARLEQVIAASGDISSATSDVSDSPVMTKLRERQAAAQAALAKSTTLFPDGSPSLNAQRAELQSIQNAIRQELNRQQTTLVADLAAARSRVRSLEAQVRVAEDRKSATDRAEVELRSLEAIATAKRAIYETVLKRLDVLLSEKRFSAPGAKVISAASVPVKPSFPNRPLFLLLALGGSLAAGLTTPYLLDRIRPAPPGLQRLAAELGVKPLAAVPLPNDFSSTEDPRLAAALFAERIRAIRNLVLDGGSGPGKVILITSSLPNEGKSLIAAFLARAISASGYPTLLLDADLRSPSASRTVGVADVRSGLGDVLENPAKLSEAIINVGESELSLLPAVASSTAPVDSLVTERMHGVIENLRQRYRYIIVDSPPIGAVSDALALAEQADETIVIFRSPTTPTTHLERSIAVLKGSEASLLGIVQTGLDEDELEHFARDDIRRYYMAGVSPDFTSPRKRTTKS